MTDGLIWLSVLGVAASLCALGLSVGQKWLRHRALREAAVQAGWNHSQQDRHDLISQIRRHPPVAGAADVDVYCVSHKGEGTTALQWVCVVEFTTGSVDRKRRRRLLAKITEHRPHGTTQVTYLPAQRLADAYAGALR